MTKMLYDKKYDHILGLTHLGRFINHRFTLTISLLKMLFKKAIGVADPGSAVLSYYFVCGHIY